jgi:hypothetical protein
VVVEEQSTSLREWLFLEQQSLLALGQVVLAGQLLHMLAPPLVSKQILEATEVLAVRLVLVRN